MEIWKDIKGYEGLYQVSNIGRVRSLDRVVIHRLGSHSLRNTRHIKGILLKPNTSSKYVQVNLSKNGIVKLFTVHRLIGITFLDNPDNKPEINHKDGNKQNNHIENLEWCSRSENIQHSFDNGLIISPNGEDHYLSKLTEIDVLQIRQLLKDGMMRKSIANMFKVNPCTIGDIKYRRTWKHI